MRVLLPASVVVALACSGLPTAERPVPRAEARPGVPVAATGLQEPLSYADFFLVLPAGASRTAAETALRSAAEARRIPLVDERGGATGLTAVTGWSAVAGSEFDPAMLPYFGRGLSEADVVGLGAATELVSVSVAGPIAQAAEVQHAGAELVASAAEASNAWIHDAFTAETFTRASFAEARPPGFSLDVQRLAVLHAVRADDGMLFLESRGLGRFGLPEVILRHVPSAYLGAMTDLVNAAGQTLVERGALTGEGALVVDLAMLRTDPWPARGAEIAAAGGSGTITLGARWTECEVHEGPLLVELRLPGEGGDTERAVGAARAFGVAAEDRFDAERGDRELEAARSRARARLSELRSHFAAGVPEGERLDVKGPFQTPGGTEWMWVNVRSWEGDRMSGELLNEPFEPGGMHAGDAVTVEFVDVFDYEWTHDGVKDGGETNEILLRRGG